MAKTKKVVNALSISALAGIMASTVLSSAAFAAVDAYTVKVGDNVFEYSTKELQESFLASKAGDDAVLYTDFAAKLEEAKGFYAFHDAKTNRYIAFENVTNAFLENRTDFKLDDYVETDKAEAVANLPQVIKAVKVVGGEIKTEDKTTGTVVTDALKVETVKSVNLKEVEIEFNKAVDEDSAKNVDNYTFDLGLTAKTATISEDGKMVTLTLTSKMDNQKECKLSIKNIKDDSKTFSAKDVAFTPLDVTLPVVEKIEALGNKAVKVTFAEPIDDTTVSVADFKIDDKAIAGTVEADGSRTAIIKTYSSLSDGTHTLKFSGVNDFAGYTIITGTQPFDVVADKEVPTVVSVDATFEYVTVKFSEPVQNVRGGSYAYWKSTTGSTTKNTASTTVKKIADDTYRFDFTGNKLPGYDAYFYVEGVKDYSENVIAKDNALQVKATVDQTRPEVKSAELNEDTYKSIVVKFTKEISNITTRSKYVLKDEDGKVVSIKNITPNGTNDQATIEVYTALEEGTYTLSIEGLKDVTTLANVMLPYTVAFEIDDNEAPEVDTVAKEGRFVTVNFTEAMSIDGNGSIANLDNYLIEYNGTTRALPSGTSLEVLNDGEGVMLILPEKIGTAAYDASKLTKIVVQRVEDVAGNVLANYSSSNSLTGSTFDVALDSLGAKNVKLVDSRTIAVVFSQNIGSGVDVSDFALHGTTVGIESVQVDGNKVTLTLNNDIYNTYDKIGTPAVTLQTLAGFKSILGTNATAESTVAIYDKVKPELASGQSTLDNTASNNVILVKFTEALNSANVANMATDFIVKRVNGDKTLVPTVDFTTQLNTADITNKTLEIVLNTSSTLVNGKDSLYSVELKADPTFVTDVKANKAVEFGTIVSSNNLDLIRPVISTAIMTKDQNVDGNFGSVGDVLTLTFSEDVKMTLGDITPDVNGCYDMTATEFAAITGLATDATGVYTAKVSNNTVTITVGVANTTLVLADGTVAVNGTDGASVITDNAHVGNTLDATTDVFLTK